MKIINGPVPDDQRIFIIFLIALLSVLVTVLLFTSLVLLKSLKKLKAQNKEISNFNELRQTFIDADNSLVFLKDEHFKYVFVNKAFRDYHKKDDRLIIGYDDFDILDDKAFAALRSKSDKDVLQNKMIIIDEFEWENKIFLSTKFPVRLSNGHYGVGAYIKEVTSEYNNIRRLEEANMALTEKEERLKLLLNTVTDASYHDALTGLYNRRFFEEELKRLDVERNLPISIIVGDVNNLKLTNDIFGHTSGDMLLKKASEIMKKACRADDIISRWGGDEFGILLPGTKGEEAEVIAKRIKTQFLNENIKGIPCSISLGIGTKTSSDQSFPQIMESAEDRMYSTKTLEHRQNSSITIQVIISNLYDDFSGEKVHSENVSKLCQSVGTAMNLCESEIKSLKEAGLLHDIGKIVLDKEILKHDSFSDKELEKVKMHPVVGYRILNSSDETLDIAKYVLSHHERWDGSGYPRGLKGKAIPKLSRIIAVAESYDAMTNKSFYKNPVTMEEALQEIQKSSGTQFDPEIVMVFIQVVSKQSVASGS